MYVVVPPDQSDVPASATSSSAEPDAEPPQAPITVPSIPVTKLRPRGWREAAAPPEFPKMRAQSAPYSPRADACVERALFLSQAEKNDLISVAGPRGLVAMLSLCRAGFERVEFAREATCAAADEASDVLLVLGSMGADQLAAAIVRTARLLRDGGRLVAEIPGPGGESVVRAALAARGMEATLPLADSVTGRLLMITVRRRLRLQEAV
jgi:hypothetical protein